VRSPSAGFRSTARGYRLARWRISRGGVLGSRARCLSTRVFRRLADLDSIGGVFEEALDLSDQEEVPDLFGEAQRVLEVALG
jgi:hypothetical protein